MINKILGLICFSSIALANDFSGDDNAQFTEETACRRGCLLSDSAVYSLIDIVNINRGVASSNEEVMLGENDTVMMHMRHST